MFDKCPLVFQLPHEPTSADYFHSNSTFHWLDMTTNKIHRSIVPHYYSRVTARNADVVQIPSSRKPTRAIAIDEVHELIYWFEKADGFDSNNPKYKLVVATIDGRYPRTLDLEGYQFRDPRDLAVDPKLGHIYVSHFNTATSQSEIIKIYNLTESPEILFTYSNGDPQGIAVDYFKSGRVYWCDKTEKTIWSVLSDGSENPTLIAFLG